MKREFCFWRRTGRKILYNQKRYLENIKTSREEGYDIEAVTNKGYRLKSCLEKISEGEIKAD